MFGTMSLTGTVIVSGTTVEQVNASGGGPTVNNALVAVTSDQVAHVVYRKKTGTTYALQYARGSGGGFVAPPTTLVSGTDTWSPIGLVADSRDKLHLFAFRESGDIYKMQLSVSGVPESPFIHLWANKQFAGALPNSVRIDRDRTGATGHIFLVYVSYSAANPEYRAYITHFAPQT